ncbi:MAG: hypothetical protein LBD99_00650 [Candidatus Margulisbacteria bacterium]|jgi:hypothetical protein|nr:hypothetical protein [Candidatus Margulisiibacteriota bacterium]
MKFQDIINKIGASAVHKSSRFDSVELKNIVVSDMMSEVLTVDKEEIFLVTSLSSHQTLRTLNNIGGAGAIIVNGSPIQAGLKELAREFDITLLKTAKPAFEVCVALGKLLEGK